jgi:uroporphyrinogen decarboxylase
MRGLENALMDTLANPDFLEAALDRIDAIQTVMLERLLSEAGDRLDLIFISDDMGMQENLLISLDSWETHFKPRLKNWCDLIHRYGKKVLYHTDGAVFPLIPGLIECGIDVLNPVQHVCPGMDTARLKQLFGKDIIFHGGIENQQILPRGTAQEVARETKTCLETLGGGGEGYICCSCHNAQAGTPVENILAMIETVNRYEL